MDYTCCIWVREGVISVRSTKYFWPNLFFNILRDNAFVCYFMLHLITMLSLFSCISLEAKLKGRQNTPMPGVMQFQRWVPAPCSTFLHDWGPSCWCPEKLLSYTVKMCVPFVPLSLPAFSTQWEDTIRIFWFSRCVGVCQGNKYSKAVRSSGAPAHT